MHKEHRTAQTWPKRKYQNAGGVNKSTKVLKVENKWQCAEFPFLLVGALFLAHKSRMFFPAAKVCILKNLLCALFVIWPSGRQAHWIYPYWDIKDGRQFINYTGPVPLQLHTWPEAVDIITRLRVACPTKWGIICVHFVLHNRCYMLTMHNSELDGFSTITYRNTEMFMARDQTSCQSASSVVTPTSFSHACIVFCVVGEELEFRAL